MRYYCRDCKTEFNTDINSRVFLGRCLACLLFRDNIGDLIKIPLFETPAQYEARTGEEPSGDAAVWVDGNTGWELYYYSEAKDRDGVILVAAGAEPPPEDYEVEEV